MRALAKHGLTLANFSSIKEQQMGGWTQVAALAWCNIAYWDEMITHMVSPGRRP